MNAYCPSLHEISINILQLAPEDLPHLFDRFWRKDAARSGGQHVGLGSAWSPPSATYSAFPPRRGCGTASSRSPCQDGSTASETGTAMPKGDAFLPVSS